MLSIYTLKTVADASSYYQQGDYYTTGGVDEHSAWLGKGAELLGLTGRVDFAIFEGLLGGYLPNGVLMTNTKQGKYHRPGYDLTFSAPKSVSILALVGDNQEVLAVYREALTETLAKIEQKYANCRNKDKGTTTIEKTNNFVMAAFEHVDSREGDPHLHTHIVLMNLTLRADGEWRTIFFDEIYDDKLLNGMEFRSRLAEKLLKLGYELEFKEKGLFEIVGVPEPLRKLYSKRREEIEQWLHEHHLEGGEAAKIANFQTRADKQNTKPAERKERWINELIAAGFSVEDLKKIYEAAKIRGPIELPDPYLLAQRTLQIAIEHLSQRHPVFTIPELIKSARLLSLLPSAEGDFLKAIEEKIQDKTLIYREDKSLTTLKAQEQSLKNIEEMQRGKKCVYKIMANWIAELVCSSKLKTDTQRAALKFLLTTEDQQVLVTAHSKPLLNEVLRAFQESCQSQRYYPRFLTQKMNSAEILKTKLNTEKVSTIEGFLLACETRAEKRNPNPHLLERWSRRIKATEARECWVVQGEISVNQVNRLQHWSKEFGARLIFSQSTYEPIFSLDSLKNNGIEHIHISTPRYYQRELKAKEAVLGSIAGLERKNAVQGMPGYQARLNLAVQRSTSLSSPPLLITLNNRERMELNALMRNHLKTQGTLKGDAISINTLQALALTAAEKSQSHLYQPGDMIRFNQAEAGTLIPKDSYFEVYKVDLESNIVELHDKQKTQVFWEPMKCKNLKKVDVFRVSSRELQVGDTIVWTRTLPHANNKALNRIKDQKGSVVTVNHETATVLLKNGETLNLNKEDVNHHWDHGYAVLLKNIELSALKESTLVLQSASLDNKTIHNLQEFFAHGGDAKLETHLICDDIKKLKENIKRGGVGNLLIENKLEIPYLRSEALSENQTISTQPIFHGLQTEYLKIRQLNPEFLDKNEGKSKDEPPYSPKFRVACDVVDRVCLYHAERKAVFSLKTLQKEAAQLGGLKTSLENIEKAFTLAIEKGWLVVVPSSKETKDTLVTPRHMLLMEKLCIQKMQAGKNKLSSIIPLDAPALKEIKEHPQLTEGQKKAIQLILTSTDRFVAIQGIAGVGKTTALKELEGVLKEVHKHCEAAGFKSWVLAGTGGAKNQAKYKSGMPSMTTAQFLTRVETLLSEKDGVDKAKEIYGHHPLIVLDEASFISTRDMFRLKTVIEQLGAHLPYFGDFKQIGSIGAGDIFNDSLAYGINKVVMKENVRLTSPTAFAAMKKAYEGDMAGTLNILKDSIEEIPNKQEALERMAEVYFLIEKSTQKQPLVITPLNEDRKFVNSAVRERLKKIHILQGEGLEIRVYLPTDRLEVDKKEISAYKLEDVIRFSTRHPRLGIKAGDYVKIADIDLKHHRLTLKLENGKLAYWAPKNLHKPSGVEIYREEQRELMQNDTIVFKRNQEAQGIFNGDRATLLNIKGSTGDVLLADGRTVTLDFNKKENQHVDYGYALTTPASQGKEEPDIITHGEGPKTYPRKTTELSVGDRVVLSREDQLPHDSQYQKNSKVTTIMEIKDKQLTLKSNEGEIYRVEAHKDRIWEYFPPFEQRKAHELPLSSSQQSLVVQITRGNRLFMVVPNLSDFQKTLEHHERTQRSALSYFDPNREALDKAVKRLVENIRGRAESIVTQESVPPFTQKEDSLKAQSSPSPTQTNYPKSKTKGNFRINKDELNYYLQRDILGYATRWLGAPKKISGPEARWEGALTVQIYGPKAAWWKCWSVDRENGKDLISLYMYLHNITTKEGYGAALRELAASCGVRLNKSHSSHSINNYKAPVKDLKTEERSQKKRVEWAREAYEKSVPIQGTLAEKYLRTYRGITGELPADFRFHAGVKHLDTQQLTPTLVAPLRDKNDRFTGIVRIYLNPDGSKFKKTYVDAEENVKKLTDKANLGIANGSAVVVQKGILPDTLWIAEGIETALSIAKALPNQTVVASTAVERLKLVPVGSEVQKVVICADNDGTHSGTPTAVMKAVAHHLAEGRRVFIAMPPKVPTGLEKYDFNDVLKQEGIEAVKSILGNMVEIKNVELLQSQEGGLSDNLEKIRKIKQTEIMPKIAMPQLEKAQAQLER